MGRINGEGSVYQRKSDGLWVCSIPLGTGPDGKRKRKTVTAKSKADLITKRRKLIRDLEDGVDVTSQSMRLSAWLDTWLTDIARKRVRPNVLRNYESIVRRHITPHIGQARLDKLTPAMIRGLHDTVAATEKPGGGRVSSRTVEVCHNTLSRALKDAVREGLMRDNPCERVDRPKVRSTERQPITAEQAKQVLAAAADVEDPLTAMWTSALLLGARKSELLGLTWDRVDTATGTVDLSWQLQALPWRHGCKPSGEGWACKKKRPQYCPDRELNVPDTFEHTPVYGAMCFTRPKTASSIRRIPAPTMVMQALAATDRRDNPHGLVWWHNDDRPWFHREIIDQWHTACDRAGVPRCDMHATRHTAATLLLEAGVSPEIIAQILGHSTIVSTQGYMHVSRSMAAGALDALQRQIEG